MIGQLIQRKDGSLQCNFADRMVLMANHQLYTDWLYLWWIAYTNNMHGFVYIILKESLRSIPIIGWSAQFYNFIFLARNWEEDQRRFKKALARINSATQYKFISNDTREEQGLGCEEQSTRHEAPASAAKHRVAVLLE
jgi:hypothetical protein